MTTVYKRQRTTSAYEERDVTSFVDSCINFTSNLSFFTSNEGVQIANELMQNPSQRVHIVLLLGNLEQLRDKAKVSAFFPYYSKEVECAINVAPIGSCYVAQITPHARILIGKVSSQASRHNCPQRPDSIASIVRDALGHARIEAGGGGGGVDIYCCESENELCIASAIARATGRPFSAKKPCAEKGYMRERPPVRVVFAPKSSPDAFACGNRRALDVAARVVQLSQCLVDAPTNLLDTTTFTEIAAGHVSVMKAAGLNVSIDIIQGEELRERGYGGIYGVGKAAEFPPHLVTLSYQPKAGIAPMEKLAFVGKGIVYDTGGLAVKPLASMRGMKHDMGGAAAVFCGFLGLALLEAPVQLSTILCLADNAIGPRSQRNDDIIRTKSGLTVEISNTDAEGRLVLSDGIYHASALLPYTPDVIVDMATLTGAQGMATGKYHAALFANTEGIESRVLQAGLRSGDLCFPILYCPEFHADEYKTGIADNRNSVTNKGNAASSAAGHFIGCHIDPRYKGEWAHIDMAATVSREEPTGYGPSLILQTFASSIYEPK